MAGNKITIGVDFVGNASGLQNTLKTIQTKINNLNIKPNIKESFNKEIDAVGKAIEKYKKAASEDDGSVASANKMSKSWSTVDKTFNSLYNHLQKMHIDPDQFFDADITSRIKEAKNAFNELEKASKRKSNAKDAFDKAHSAKNNEKKQEATDQLEKLKTVGSRESINKLRSQKKEEVEIVKQAQEEIKKLEEQKETTTDTSKISSIQKQIDEQVKIVENGEKKIKNLESRIKTSQEKKDKGALLEDDYKRRYEGLEKTIESINQEQLESEKELTAATEAEVQKRIAAHQKEEAATNAINIEKGKIDDVANIGDSGKEQIDENSEALDENRKAQENFEKQTRNTQAAMDRMKRAFSIGSVITVFTKALRTAYQTIKDLDAAMTETAVVTNFSVSDMWDQLDTYTKNANKLGATTQGAYETLTLYYQQGLTSEQSWDLGIETMKMARIAGMDYAEATDMMTAALRGFNMELNETSAQHINDVYSELAAITASDTYEISEAMTRTASIAASAGLDFDTASTYLAEAIETTREAPENIGTAMKTIVARFASLTKDPAELSQDMQDALGGETVDANRVEAALKAAGVAARDSNGEFRNLSDVFLELNEKWDSLDLMTQRYVATQAAGTRQQSRFIAMMQNYERTQELLTAAKSSTGAGEAQFEKTLDSMEAKVNKLKNAWNEFTMNIMNSDFLKGAIDAATTFLDIINKVDEMLSGLPKPIGDVVTSLMAAGSIMGGFTLGKNVIQGDKLRDQIAEGKTGAGNLGKSFTDRSYFKEKDKLAQRYKDNEKDIPERNNTGIDNMFNAADWAIWKKQFRDAIKLNSGDLSQITEVFDNLPNEVKTKLEQQDIIGVIIDSMVQDYSKMTNITDKSALEEQRKKYAAKAKTIYEHNGEDIGKTAQGLIKTGIRQNKKLGGDGSFKLGGGRFNAISSVSEGLSSFSEKAQQSSIAINQIGTALSAAGFETAAAGLSVFSGIVSGIGGVAQVASMGLTKLNSSMQGLTGTEFLGKITGLGQYTDAIGKTHGTSIKDFGGLWGNGVKNGAVNATELALNNKRSSGLKKSSFSAFKKGGNKGTLSSADLKLFGSNGKLSAGFKGISKETTGATKGITKFLGAVLGLPGPLLAAGAAVTALVVGYELYTKKFSAEAKYKAASSAADTAAANADRLKAAYDNLNTSVENLDSIKEGFNGLVEGTAEWTAKLLEANQAILNITHTFPKLMQYVSINDNGLMSIYDEGLNKYKEALNDQLAAAQAVQQISEAKKATAYNHKESAANAWEAAKNMIGATLALDKTSAGRQKARDDFKYAKESYDLSEQNNANTEKMSTISAIQTKIRDNGTKNENEVSDKYLQSISTMLYGAYEKQAEQAKKDIGVKLDKGDAEEYARYNNLTLQNHKMFGEDTFTDLEGNEVKVSHEDIATTLQYSKALDTTAESASQLEKALYHADAQASVMFRGMTVNDMRIDDSDVSTIFSDILSRNGNMNQDLVDALASSSGLSDDMVDSFIESFGNDKAMEAQALASLLNEDVKNVEKDLDHYEQALRDAINTGITDIDKAQQERDKELATMLLETQRKDNGFGFKDADELSGKKGKKIRKQIAKEIRQLNSEQKSFLTNVGSQIKNAGGTEAESTFLETMKKVYGEGFTNKNGEQIQFNAQEVQGVQEYFEGINWSNPIDAAASLQQALDSTDESLQLVAEDMIVLNESTFNAAEQIQYFVASADYEDLTESLQQYIDADGKISGDNIREVAESNKNLQKMMENTNTSAEAMGAIFTAMATTGKISIDSLTSGFMALMSGIGQLQDVTHEAISEIENFDPGIDEGTPAEAIKGWTESIQEMVDNGEWGNSQLQNYLKKMFGEETWNELYAKYDGNLSKVEQELAKRTNKFADGDFYKAWEDLTSGKYTEKLNKAGLSVTKNDDGSIHLVSYSKEAGKALDTLQMSTDDTVKALMDVYDISETTAKAMLTDFKNYSSNLEQELQGADILDSVKNIKDKITHTFGSGENEFQASFMFSSDFDNVSTTLKAAGIEGRQLKEYWEEVAKAAGVSEEEISKITNAERLNGKEGKELVAEYNKMGEELKQAALNSDLVLHIETDDKNLITNINSVRKQLNNLEGANGNFFQQFAKNGKISLEEITSALMEAGFTMDQATQLIEDSAAKGEFEFLDYDGEVAKAEDIGAKIKESLEKAAEEANYEPMANAIVKALSNLKLDIGLNGIGLKVNPEVYDNTKQSDAVDTSWLGLIKEAFIKLVKILAMVTAGMATLKFGFKGLNSAAKAVSSGGLKSISKMFNGKGFTGVKSLFNKGKGKSTSLFNKSGKAQESTTTDNTTASVKEPTKRKPTKNGKSVVKASYQGRKIGIQKSIGKTPSINTSVPGMESGKPSWMNSAGKTTTATEAATTTASKGGIKSLLKTGAKKASSVGSKIKSGISTANPTNSTKLGQVFTKGTKFGGAVRGVAGIGTALTLASGAKDFITAKTTKGKSKAIGGTAGTLAGAAAGAKLGALAGSVVPGLGTGVGALVGGGVGALAGSKAGRFLGGYAVDKGKQAKNFIFGNKKTGEKDIFGKGKDFIFGNKNTGQKSIFGKVLDFQGKWEKNKAVGKEGEAAQTKNQLLSTIASSVAHIESSITGSSKAEKELQSIKSGKNKTGTGVGDKLKKGAKLAALAASPGGIGKLPALLAGKAVGSLFKKFKGTDNNKDKKINAASLLNIFKAQSGKIKQNLQQKQNKPNTTVNKKGQVTVDTKQKGYIKSINEAAAKIKAVKVNTEQKGLLKSIKKTLTGADNVEIGVEVSTKGVNNLVTKTASIIESFDALNNLSNPDLDVDVEIPSASNLTSINTLSKNLQDISNINDSNLKKNIEINKSGITALSNKIPELQEDFDKLNKLTDINLRVSLTLPTNINSLDTLTEDLTSISKIANSSLTKDVTINKSGIDTLHDKKDQLIQDLKEINETKIEDKTVKISWGGSISVDGLTKVSDALKTIANTSDLTKKVDVQAPNGQKLQTKADNIVGAFETIEELDNITRKITIDMSEANTNKVKNLAKNYSSLSGQSDINKKASVDVDDGDLKNKAADISDEMSSLSAVKDVSKNVSINVTGTDKLNALKTSITGITGSTHTATVNVKTSGVKAAQAKISGITGKTVKITPSIKQASKTIYVQGKNVGSVKVAYQGQNLGTAAFGSMAQGAKRGKLGPRGKGGPTLTGELGQEIVWEPDKSSAYLVGVNGPEVVDLPGNAIVWPADQTKRILQGQEHMPIGGMATGNVFGSMADAYGPRVNTSAGSSSPSKKKKKKASKKNQVTEDQWENPYDEYYNLLNRINKELRIRDRLEKRYSALIKSEGSSIADLIKNWNAQMKILSDTIDDSTEMIKRKKEQANLLDDDVIKKGSNDANTKNVVTVNVSDYVTWDDISNRAIIDWDALEEIETKSGKSGAGASWKKIGEALEKIISTMEEYQDAIEEAEGNVDDALSTQTDMLEELADSFIDSEESVVDILTDLKQQEIDKLTELNDSVNDANDRITDSIQKNIDRIRQQRENEKTEKDLSEKQRRLAFLKQDTSGANALEIKQLEEEIKDAQRDYQDNLIDQSLDSFSEKLEEASNQREQMISLLEKQLEYMTDTGGFAGQSHELMAKAIKTDGTIDRQSEIFQKLRQSSDYLAASFAKRAELEKDLEEKIKAYGVYMSNTQEAKTFGTGVKGAGSTATVGGKIGYDFQKQASGGYKYKYKDENGNELEDFVSTIAYDAQSAVDGREAYFATSGDTRSIEDYILDTYYGKYNVKDDYGNDTGEKAFYNVEDLQTMSSSDWAKAEKTDKNRMVSFEPKDFGQIVGGQKVGKLIGELVTSGSHLGDIKVGNRYYQGIERYLGEDGKYHFKSHFTDSLPNGRPSALTDLQSDKMYQGYNVNSDAVKAYQTALSELGYYAGDINGKLNEATISAIKTIFPGFAAAGTLSKDTVVNTDNNSVTVKKKTPYYIISDALRNAFASVPSKSGARYATGGLADYTGPAWLDGTYSKPELVLNAKDTANFIQLKNILSSLMSGNITGGTSTQDTYNISINVEEIGNDYDVDQMINKVKKEITKAAGYRNVNAVSRRR